MDIRSFDYGDIIVNQTLNFFHHVLFGLHRPCFKNRSLLVICYEIINYRLIGLYTYKYGKLKMLIYFFPRWEIHE
jgi:hypothetical protein